MISVVGSLREVVACAGGVLLAACGLQVSGLAPGADGGVAGTDAHEDVSYGGNDATSEGADGTAGDAGTDVSTGDAKGDVFVEATPADGCVPTGPENCTNGKDDDCNGLTDCADPACMSAGYVCVSPVPSGWDYVAFDPTGRPSCPGGLAAAAFDVDPTDLTSPAQCGCACNVSSSPSCNSGMITATPGNDNTCTGAGATGMFPANDGQCNVTGHTVAAFVNVSGPPPVGGTCTPQASDVNPSTGATQGETCGGETMFGAGCSGGQVCALAPSGFQGCIHHGGQLACIAGSGYTQPNAVGTLNDTRGCGSCTCSGTPMTTCAAGSWTFYDNANCSGGGGLTITANGQCDQNSGNPTHTFQSNAFTASPNPATCAQPTPPQPTGSVQLQMEDTVCCP
jgi:hypothetical protein